MTPLETFIRALDTGFWELGEAFKGLEDRDVWVRPHPRLLSIGEIASHVAYGHDMNILGGKSESPLLVPSSRYYFYAVDESLGLDFGAEALFAEVMRVHEKVKEFLTQSPPDLTATNPHRPDWTWHQTMEYMNFHVAYHTGQIYSVRHLMGHETEDN